MIEAWAVADVYAAEAALMAQLPEGELMARAVAALAEITRVRAASRGARRVVALVGSGNNGGDALYAAASLATHGLDVSAVYRPDRVHAGASAAAIAAGVRMIPDSGDDLVVAEIIGDAQIVLDGILGIGGRAGLPGFSAPWVRAISPQAYVIAVDLPSGQAPDGSRLDPDGVFADETVTFSAAKPVHLLPATEPAVGILTVAEIGLQLSTSPAVRRLTRDDVASIWPIPGPTDDKYSRGVLGVVAGGEAYTGAAVLAVTAAVSAGVGMVRYFGTPAPTALVRSAVPEAVHGLGQVQAWVVGPGFDSRAEGVDAAAQLEVASAALAGPDPVLVDAGGLDLIQGPRPAPTLLTPHAGECARLLQRLTGRAISRAEVAADPGAYAQELAALTTSTVLLKGSTTIIARPDGGPLWSQADAPPWLATAGAGDVLAGLGGALLAAGLAPDLAGALAALVHGIAADQANPGGPVRALDVARALPATIAGALRRG